MSLWPSIRNTLLKFGYQLELTPKRLASWLVGCVAAGVAFDLALRVFPLVWAAAIPLIMLFGLKLYGQAVQSLLSDRQGSYRTLIASGIQEAGYWLGAAAVLVASFSLPLTLLLVGLVGARFGPLAAVWVLVGLALALPWLLMAQLVLCRAVMRAADAQLAEALANYGLAAVIGLPVALWVTLRTLVPARAAEVLAGLGRLVGYWPLGLILSWGALALVVAWLARRG